MDQYKSVAKSSKFQLKKFRTETVTGKPIFTPPHPIRIEQIDRRKVSRDPSPKRYATLDQNHGKIQELRAASDPSQIQTSQ